MAKAKQMMDLRSTKKNITEAESNEQQRKWSKEFYEKKSKIPWKNYDPTRAHLNFEVTKGGKIQTIDTSKSIDEKMKDILVSRSIPNPNEKKDCKQPQRILAQILFGGNRERMRELAFGDQEVDFGKNADNSHLTRREDIEKWAVDVYNHVAKKYGEENIVSFYVHLDEINPHIHCALLPVDPNRNRISWTSVFGKNKKEESEAMRKAHTDYFNDVGEKWGLVRGSDIKETGAKHRSTAEYERDLINNVVELEDTVEDLKKQIATEERKRKSFTTMIENLQKHKEEIEAELGELGKLLDMEGQDPKDLMKKINKLRKEMETVNGKLDERKQMLDNTIALLTQAKEKLDQMKAEETDTSVKIDDLKKQHAHLLATVNDNVRVEAERVIANINGTFNKMLKEAFEPVLDTLDRDQREVLHESGFYDLADKANDVIGTALLLAINFVNEATQYAESHGGGGGSNMTGWGRKNDDDDDQWWRRCIRQAAEMMKPSRGRSRRQ